MEMELGKEKEEIYKNYIIKLGEVNGLNIITILNDYFVFYLITKTNIFNLKLHSTFIFNNWYLLRSFQGIILDSGAAGVSTAGKPQFIAFQKLNPTVQINIITAGQHKIWFGKGKAFSYEIINIPTPLRTITFHIILANTPFLFCI